MDKSLISAINPLMWGVNTKMLLEIADYKGSYLSFDTMSPNKNLQGSRGFAAMVRFKESPTHKKFVNMYVIDNGQELPVNYNEISNEQFTPFFQHDSNRPSKYNINRQCDKLSAGAAIGGSQLSAHRAIGDTSTQANGQTTLDGEFATSMGPSLMDLVGPPELKVELNVGVGQNIADFVANIEENNILSLHYVATNGNKYPIIARGPTQIIGPLTSDVAPTRFKMYDLKRTEGKVDTVKIDMGHLIAKLDPPPPLDSFITIDGIANYSFHVVCDEAIIKAFLDNKKDDPITKPPTVAVEITTTDADKTAIVKTAATVTDISTAAEAKEDNIIVKETLADNTIVEHFYKICIDNHIFILQIYDKNSMLRDLNGKSANSKIPTVPLTFKPMELEGKAWQIDQHLIY
jgi:hypothetical protein